MVKRIHVYSFSFQNPDIIVGKFVGLPDSSLVHMTTCTSPNDTVTHSSPEDKPAMTFQWLAPIDFLGGIEFRYKTIPSLVLNLLTADLETA